MTQTDVKGAEHAYRKALELSSEPFYAAYVDLGALLCEDERRCDEALLVFEQALIHFPEDVVLHFNRAVALEGVGRLDDAERGYAQCLERNPSFANAHHNLGLLRGRRGDKQGLVRHLIADFVHHPPIFEYAVFGGRRLRYLGRRASSWPTIMKTLSRRR
jgi:tetratricopeptide (TPR) repeat protein